MQKPSANLAFDAANDCVLESHHASRGCPHTHPVLTTYLCIPSHTIHPLPPPLPGIPCVFGRGRLGNIAQHEAAMLHAVTCTAGRTRKSGLQLAETSSLPGLAS
jgi:hypothetical protein